MSMWKNLVVTPPTSNTTYSRVNFQQGGPRSGDREVFGGEKVLPFLRQRLQLIQVDILTQML
jgi:hypothetical protein